MDVDPNLTEIIHRTSSLRCYRYPTSRPPIKSVYGVSPCVTNTCEELRLTKRRKPDENSNFHGGGERDLLLPVLEKNVVSQ